MNNSNTNSILANASTKVKPAAIWARVSTSSQAESSLPSQVSRCKEKLAQAGYTATRIFSVDFSSLDLYACPEFQELRKLIMNGEIEAVAVYDRDRLAAPGLQRLTFIADLKDNAVELVICEGSPVIDGPEGQIVELALAIGKERQVLRASQGSRDGLHDKAELHRKPVRYHKVNGYEWSTDNKRLVPNSDYGTVKLILELLLAGNGYNRVVNELKKRAIPSPGNNAIWTKNAIHDIAHNPIYAGKYYALRHRAVPPKGKSKSKRRNSSMRRLPLSEAIYLPEIKILKPPITWPQRLQILEQSKKRQKLSSRNAKFNYLLRGRIFCVTHIGSDGEPRRYHGQPHGKSYRYICPIGGCDSPVISGPGVESLAKRTVLELFKYKTDEFYGLLQKNDCNPKNLKVELLQLKQKAEKNLNNLAQLEDDRINDVVDAEIYERLQKKYQATRQQIKDRQDFILDQLMQLDHEREAVASWQDIKLRFLSRFIGFTDFWHDDNMTDQLSDDVIAGFSDNALLGLSDEVLAKIGRLDVREKPLLAAEWQELFNAIDFELHVHPRGVKYDKKVKKEIWVLGRGDKAVILVVKCSLPIQLQPKNIGKIVLSAPG